MEVPLRQLRGDIKWAVRYTGFWLIGEKIRGQEKIGNCQGEALVPDEGTLRRLREKRRGPRTEP